MAWLFGDSFDWYQTADLMLRWPGSTLVTGASNISIDTVNGRNGTGAAKYTYGGNNSPIFLGKAVPASGATAIIGIAFNPTTLTMNAEDFRGGLITVYWGATAQCSVRYNKTDGSISFLRGQPEGGTIVGTSAAGQISATNTWYYIELKVVLGTGTAGSFDVHLNTASIVSGSGVNTAGAAVTTWDSYRLFANSADLPNLSGGFWYIDDTYCCDGSSAINNDFLGPIRGRALLADGAGTYTQFTPSAGANYTCVDDPLFNGDTDYVASSTPGQIDSYNFGALGITGSVKAVQLNLMVRSAAGAGETIAPVVRVGSTDYVGANITALSTGYTDKLVLYENSPATSVPWTVSEIDGAQFGLKLVS